MAIFVGGHFALSSLPVRRALTDRLGDGAFRGLYSLLAAGSLVWVGIAYGDARSDSQILWAGPPALAMIPLAVLPISCILLVCSITSRNPTAIGGGERSAADPKPLSGIVTVTRHPMLVGFALWAAAHIPVNGDAASLVLFGGILLLCVGGMLHIDHRRRVTLGAGWGPIALTTGVVPFLAALQGRTKVDWGGIGPWRVAAGLALFVALLYGHPWIAGVPILPHGMHEALQDFVNPGKS